MPEGLVLLLPLLLSGFLYKKGIVVISLIFYLFFIFLHPLITNYDKSSNLIFCYLILLGPLIIYLSNFIVSYRKITNSSLFALFFIALNIFYYFNFSAFENFSFIFLFINALFLLIYNDEILRWDFFLVSTLCFLLYHIITLSIELPFIKEKGIMICSFACTFYFLNENICKTKDVTIFLFLLVRRIDEFYQLEIIHLLVLQLVLAFLYHLNKWRFEFDSKTNQIFVYMCAIPFAIGEPFYATWLLPTLIVKDVLLKAYTAFNISETIIENMSLSISLIIFSVVSVYMFVNYDLRAFIFMYADFAFKGLTCSKVILMRLLYLIRWLIFYL